MIFADPPYFLSNGGFTVHAGKHDFRSLEIIGRRFLWKIDYYDPKLEFGFADPSDPGKTIHVLTIILAEEY